MSLTIYLLMTIVVNSGIVNKVIFNRGWLYFHGLVILVLLSKQNPSALPTLHFKFIIYYVLFSIQTSNSLYIINPNFPLQQTLQQYCGVKNSDALWVGFSAVVN